MVVQRKSVCRVLVLFWVVDSDLILFERDNRICLDEVEFDAVDVACCCHVRELDPRDDIASDRELRGDVLAVVQTAKVNGLTESLHRYAFHSPIPGATPRLWHRRLLGPIVGFGLAEIRKFLTYVCT